MTTDATPAAVTVAGVVDVRGAEPACFPDEPCDPPVTAGFVVLSRAGEIVVRAPVGARGAFSTQVPPGTYAVTVAPGGPGLRVRPATLTVPPGGLTEVRLRLVPARS